MFKRSKRVKSNNEKKNPIVSIILTLIMNDEKLFKPFYLKELKTEADSEMKDDLPLVYLWNEDYTNGTFSLSVNGRIIGKMLESYCIRSDPQFVQIRDEIIKVISETSKQTVVSICSKLGKSPSEIFGI